MRLLHGMALLALLTFSGASIVRAQEAGARKIVNQVSPAYPSLARSLNLAGTVKLEAVVSPTGSVKSVAIKGGNPVLAQSAADAVTKWKWEPANRETQELIQLNFKPQ